MTVLSFAILVVGIWALAFYASRTLHADMERLLGEQQKSTVSILATEIDQELVDRLRGLETQAKDITPALMGKRAALQQFLEKSSLLQRFFNGGISVIRYDGIAIAEVPLSANRIGSSYIERDFVLATLKEGKSTVGRPVMGKKLQAPIFTLTVPIRDAQGQVIGALAGVINLGMPNFLDKITEPRCYLL